MSQSSLMYWPVIAMIGLTACVWTLMYVRRISEIRSKNIDRNSLKTRKALAENLNDTNAADNFKNLLEAPVLFYTLSIFLLLTNEVSLLQLFLAWLFVVLRCIHSFIHVTYNDVMQRWIAYMASMLCLFTMWVIFAISLLMLRTS